MTQQEKDRLECLRLAQAIGQQHKLTAVGVTEVAEVYYQWVTKDLREDKK